MTRAEFEAGWDGRLVLMTKRAALTDLARRFDITWFLGAIHKYRRLLSEVLVASFFLQLFALVSPLFFQVVIDKVLVHRSMSTLDVLVIGLAAIALFETILGHAGDRVADPPRLEIGDRQRQQVLEQPRPEFDIDPVGRVGKQIGAQCASLKTSAISSPVRR
jgi:ABC-type bacteriocin/lantibiotic exporter with double-glycine peptidase domain